jgi:integrase
MRLTDTITKQLPAPERGNKIAFDDAVKGFGVRVTAAGARAFVLDYRRKVDGKQRRITIGAWPDWSTTAAREEAKRLKREIDGGADPIGEEEAVRAAPSMADLCARFLEEYVPRKRPATQRDYRQQIGTDILPAIGKMKVAAVTFADVDSLHRKISKRAPTHANRVLALFSRMFTMAIRWGMRPDNPVKGIERNMEGKRQRYASPAELARLSAALAELRDQGAANAVRLMLLTGARRGEVLAARWKDFDLPAGVWTKPASATKQKRIHTIPLSDAARQLLGKMQDEADDSAVYLFPARRTPYRLDIDDAWATLRKAANIPDVRLHDLRHTYASVLASAGLSLPVIGALLGHATPVTTARYSHLFDDPLRQATERASAIITSKAAAEIVPLKGARREG